MISIALPVLSKVGYTYMKMKVKVKLFSVKVIKLESEGCVTRLNDSFAYNE